MAAKPRARRAGTEHRHPHTHRGQDPAGGSVRRRRAGAPEPDAPRAADRTEPAVDERGLARVSISLEPELLDRLEDLIRRNRYTNRSEFVRDLIRDRLVHEAWQADEEAVGTVTLVYNHHQRRLPQKLVDLQHHHHGSILAVTHVHLDEELCAEAILVRGPASEIRRIADLLRQQKGVLHATLSMGTTGRDLP